MANDDSEFLDKPVIIFGRDVRKIPCFRDSLLYGIGGGLAGGLFVFMLTSKPRLGSHSAVGIFGCLTITYFMVCRHRWAEQRFNIGQIYGATRRPEYPNNLVPEQENPKKVEVASV